MKYFFEIENWQKYFSFIFKQGSNASTTSMHPTPLVLCVLYIALFYTCWFIHTQLNGSCGEWLQDLFTCRKCGRPHVCLIEISLQLCEPHFLYKGLVIPCVKQEIRQRRYGQDGCLGYMMAEAISQSVVRWERLLRGRGCDSPIVVFSQTGMVWTWPLGNEN
jgi:hypothetical protein